MPMLAISPTAPDDDACAYSRRDAAHRRLIATRPGSPGRPVGAVHERDGLAKERQDAPLAAPTSTGSAGPPHSVGDGDVAHPHARAIGRSARRCRYRPAGPRRRRGCRPASARPRARRDASRRAPPASCTAIDALEAARSISAASAAPRRAAARAATARRRSPRVCAWRYRHCPPPVASVAGMTASDSVGYCVARFSYLRASAASATAGVRADLARRRLRDL